MARLTANGVLVIDKPTGPTSHDIVAGARRVYGTRSVGHAGTLDPMATGVLVLLFGEATKLSNYLTNQSKTYRARVRLGSSTDSGDADGKPLAQCAVPNDWQEGLTAALELERHRTSQLPPTLSSIKVAGKPAHRRVRAGQEPVLSERAVKVEHLELLEADATSLSVQLRVSKGYYVRSFARDLAASLGVPAHLDALRRLTSGNFSLERAAAWPLDTAIELTSTRDAALSCLGSGTLTESGTQRCRQGKLLSAHDFMALPADDDEVQVWLDPRGQLVALGRRQEPDQYRVVRGFQQNP